MNTTKLYLIRHGETEQNKTGVLMGSTDTPLNDQGREQARQLRNRINALAVDTIFSSDGVFPGEPGFLKDAVEVDHRL